MVSNTPPRFVVTWLSEVSISAGLRLAMAPVMPNTVPKKPQIGIAQITIRMKAKPSCEREASRSARYFSSSSSVAADFLRVQISSASCKRRG